VKIDCAMAFSYVDQKQIRREIRWCSGNEVLEELCSKFRAGSPCYTHAGECLDYSKRDAFRPMSQFNNVSGGRPRLDPH
jgi:hypothetical protein